MDRSIGTNLSPSWAVVLVDHCRTLTFEDIRRMFGTSCIEKIVGLFFCNICDEAYAWLEDNKKTQGPTLEDGLPGRDRSLFKGTDNNADKDFNTASYSTGLNQIMDSGNLNRKADDDSAELVINNGAGSSTSKKVDDMECPVQLQTNLFQTRVITDYST
ncbi:hypothetical protein Tco_1282069 [Tanacetum coccineum]